MSNHYHLVLKVNDTKSWSDKQVLIQWDSLCKLPNLCQKFMGNEVMENIEKGEALVQIEEYRKRLMSVSWFMKYLNQYIAFKANAEDNCKGHFWEARFKSQALLDEAALLTAMTYVDLNPIRAAIARTPEASKYTSIAERINNKETDLMSFGKEQIPFKFTDYLNLIDATGHVVIESKSGHIPKELPDVLQRLNLNQDTWLKEFNSFKTKGITAVGTVDQLKGFCSNIGKKYRFGLRLKPAFE